MFNALGVGGGGSLIGGVALLLAPIPFIFYKYGGPIRERSKFAPTPEKKDGDNQEASREEDMICSRNQSTSGTSEDESDSTVDFADNQGAGPNNANEKEIMNLDGMSEARFESDLEKGQA